MRKSILDLKPSLEPIRTSPIYIWQYSDGWVFECFFPNGDRLIVTANSYSYASSVFYKRIRELCYSANQETHQYLKTFDKRPKGATVKIERAENAEN